MPDLRVTDVRVDGPTVEVAVRAAQRTACCPLCLRPSQRVRSHYVRTVRDLPCTGRSLVIQLHVRRFACAALGCSRRVFSERMPLLVTPHGRRTLRAQEQVRRLAFATGGEGAARLSTAEGIPLSPRTVLRVVRATPLPAPEAVQVLGVDDWSQHKGHTYGTILVDLERHVPLDLLPDRTAATLADWLSAHPEVETISRDRSGAYAEGARQGAPQAQQIADRWHLLASLSAAADEALGRQRSALQHAARAATADDRDSPTTVASLAAPASTDPPPTVQRAHRLAVYDAVRTLHAEGATLTTIAAQMHPDRATVRRYIRGGLPVRMAPLTPTCPSALRAYVAYLQARWDAGCHRADRL